MRPNDPRRFSTVNITMNKKKSSKVTCPDCGAKYSAGAPHTMFCPAHTCDVCGTSYNYVVGQQDRSDTGETRVCYNCVEQGR